MPEPRYGSLPFTEAIEYLRGKINLPTERYTDIMRGMHSRAFVVAGATKSDLLVDLHEAVMRGIEGKSTLADFRKEFDHIVKRHGWEYKGNRGFRTSTIYYTNLSTAYAAGREKQMTDPDVVKAFPYARYRTMDDDRVRALHQSWNNVVLPQDDPWWDDHTPPNGWGCRCRKETFSRRQYDAALKDPAYRTERPNDGTYEWKNPSTGQTEQVPAGIDPGWDYNPGQTAWGKNIAQDLAAENETGAWSPLDPLGPFNYNRGSVPIDNAQGSYSLTKQTDFFDSPSGETIAVTSIPSIASIPSIIPSLLQSPYEIWLAFEQNDKTRKVRVRQSFVAAAKIDGKKTGIVATVVNSRLIALAAIALKNLDSARSGRLLWGREWERE